MCFFLIKSTCKAKRTSVVRALLFVFLNKAKSLVNITNMLLPYLLRFSMRNDKQEISGEGKNPEAHISIFNFNVNYNSY